MRGVEREQIVVRRLLVTVVALAALVTAAVATASGPTMTLTPTSVKRGHTVVISGSAGGCPAGDAVTIISRAFAHKHEFAGVPAVFAKVKASGSYRVATRIPANRKPIHFRVTARCGGGNFGIVRHLIVLA